MGNDASLEQRIGEEIDNNTFPGLATAWSEFQALLAPAALQEYLLLITRQQLELAFGTEDLMVILVVDSKHFLVTVVEQNHVKGVDLAIYEGSAKKGSEVQLNIWFLDNTRFFWEPGLEEVEQMKEFTRYVRRFLGRTSQPAEDSLKTSRL